MNDLKQEILLESGINVGPKKNKSNRKINLFYHTDVDGIISGMLAYRQIIKQGYKPEQIKIFTIDYNDKKTEELLQHSNKQDPNVVNVVVDYGGNNKSLNAYTTIDHHADMNKRLKEIEPSIKTEKNVLSKHGATKYEYVIDKEKRNEILNKYNKWLEDINKKDFIYIGDDFAYSNKNVITPDKIIGDVDYKSKQKEYEDKQKEYLLAKKQNSNELPKIEKEGKKIKAELLKKTYHVLINKVKHPILIKSNNEKLFNDEKNKQIKKIKEEKKLLEIKIDMAKTGKTWGSAAEKISMLHTSNKNLDDMKRVSNYDQGNNEEYFKVFNTPKNNLDDEQKKIITPLFIDKNKETMAKELITNIKDVEPSFDSIYNYLSNKGKDFNKPSQPTKQEIEKVEKEVDIKNNIIIFNNKVGEGERKNASFIEKNGKKIPFIVDKNIGSSWAKMSIRTNKYLQGDEKQRAYKVDLPKVCLMALKNTFKLKYEQEKKESMNLTKFHSTIYNSPFFNNEKDLNIYIDEIVRLLNQQLSETTLDSICNIILEELL